MIKKTKKIRYNNKIIYEINKKSKNTSYILKIYQMLRDVDYIFNNEKIQYYIDGGTLLGAVRHTGIIPWDDDADICILESDEHKLPKIKFKLNQFGYDIIRYWGGYKIFLIDGDRIQVENTNWRWNTASSNNKRKNIKYTFPFIDISIVKINKNKYVIYKDKKVRKIWSKCEHKLYDLYPLKKYKFGLIKLFGPHHPELYLNKCYGPEWKEIKKETYDHLNQRFIKKKPVKMKNKDFLPALPLGPIIKKVLHS